MTGSEAETRVYQLKVSIAGARPPIWRRALVPARSTLADLHAVIQALMGWQDSHLHQFEAPESTERSLKTRCSRRDARRFGPTTDPAGQPFDWLMEDDLEDEARAVLQEIAQAEKTHFLYVYDMGEYWEHDIIVEKLLIAKNTLPAALEGAYPICLAGKRNGPIEDCGGVWGYEEMLEILADANHPDHEDRKAWLKEIYGVHTWDGDAFDQEEINKRLKKLRLTAELPPSEAANK